MHEGKDINPIDESSEDSVEPKSVSTDTVSSSPANGDVTKTDGDEAKDTPKTGDDLLLEQLTMAEAEPATMSEEPEVPTDDVDEPSEKSDVGESKPTDDHREVPESESTVEQPVAPVAVPQLITDNPEPSKAENRSKRHESKPNLSEPEPLPPVPEPGPEETASTGSIGSADERRSHLMERFTSSVRARSERNRLLTLIISIFAALLIFGGGSFALYYWYQNPQKVLTDALAYMINAESLDSSGVITIASASADLTINLESQFDSGSMRQAATVDIRPKGGQAEQFGFLTFDGEVMYDSFEERIYLRLSGLSPVYESLIDNYIETRAAESIAEGEQISDGNIADSKQKMKSLYAPIIKEFDDQWITIPASEIEETVDPDGGEACSIDSLRAAFRDQAVIDAFRKHQFLVVRDHLGSAGGSVGYLVGLDHSEVSAFADAVSDTELGRSLESCGVNLDEATIESGATNEDIRFELWADKWSHVPTRIVVVGPGGDNDFTMDIKTEFDADLDIEAPTDAKTFDQIQADLESLIFSLALTAQS